jgi:hypothetical protein
MAMTLTEIREMMKELDEITLLETLNINSEMLVDRFSDLIEDKADVLERDLEEEDDGDYMSEMWQAT